MTKPELPLLNALGLKRDSETLVEQIASYWEAKGFARPALAVKGRVDNNVQGRNVYSITSDMVNGYPRQRIVALAAE